MSIYSIRTIPVGYRVAKFDDALNFETSYDMPKLHNGVVMCSCPAANRHTCRHRDMLEIFKDEKHIGDGWFYDYDNDQWIEGGSNVDEELQS